METTGGKKSHFRFRFLHLFECVLKEHFIALGGEGVKGEVRSEEGCEISAVILTPYGGRIYDQRSFVSPARPPGRALRMTRKQPHEVGCAVCLRIENETLFHGI